MKVVVAGSTGLVGRATIEALLARPELENVVALVRREWPDAPAHPRLTVRILDFERLGPGVLPPANAVVCGLGTTMRIARSP